MQPDGGEVCECCNGVEDPGGRVSVEFVFAPEALRTAPHREGSKQC